MIEIDRPQIEGSVAVGEGRRRMGFAEFGDPQGRAVFWLHGTPGARRQIPLEARRWAATNGVRLLGVDRPGVGSSTEYRYDNVVGFAADLRTVADNLGIDRFAVIGLSGGGPYTLGVAHALSDRVVAAAVLGGVAPTVGPDAISGGAMELGKRLSGTLEVAGAPIGRVLSSLMRVARPVADPAIAAFGMISHRADRQLLARPEFRAMFADDLLNGGKHRMEAPLSDIIVFARDWGFRLADITVPVRVWHGDSDWIIPHAHGEHVANRLPDAKFYTLPGDSHLSALNTATDILEELMTIWDEVAVE
ncbi:alpha/beta hydrolase [uncultured Williamsia sp.]|uniref:alpha/beta fold hydrolase n=1 Tax=uncultured Williamsia sp. TaxID=259311 RepID=UPI00261CC335|nr:alpha/beta hydrolase [uncultured Williamsia sp.]